MNTALPLRPTPRFDPAPFEALTVADLTARRSDKWTRFPGHIGAGIAEMDFGTAPAVEDAVTEAVRSGLLGYLPRWLSADLARATAEWHLRRYGWPVDPAHIRAMPDVLEILTVVLSQFHDQAAPVAVLTPAYMPFLTIPRVMGLTTVEVPMREDHTGWSIDEAALDRALAAGARTLILCNPHNPLGKVYTAAELARVAALVDRHGARVFSDEIHAPITFTPSRHVPYASVPGAAGHSITAVSATKAFNMPGLKCAQVIIPDPATRDRWAEVAHWNEHKTSTLGALATVAAYDRGEDWLTDVLAYLRRNLTLLDELLRHHAPGVRMRVPAATYIAWLDCRPLLAGTGPIALDRHFGAFGVDLVTGAECGAAGAGFVRFNCAMPRPILEQSAERLAEAVAALHQPQHEQGRPFHPLDAAGGDPP
ncbi:MalY/PatB family protein [Streptomyces radicis]|uniref:cysteine-S-conjugate beta-lyase n=1 Tax=Streptomyces radicis TaxID=1750517 RepID=A0A3A9WI20_9ACTN|nr:aminotransferase class I/II-fold pyridoxal phosphate-dependent enzyme [Streptomyces radicis]RKN12429.1 aminotransferase class I/II-fold pyridoxal phosphate-dependent enzyme [Streptomyces radicis]RKN27801.1 aminotransferase class I/II-fold pyridoxal phosphate-dependent enzyme [Streptomyces radicis]